jgi:DNA (cytosine-5)-methyltransferase 1
VGRDDRGCGDLAGLPADPKDPTVTSAELAPGPPVDGWELLAQTYTGDLRIPTLDSPTVVSLFSGVGGLDAGFEMAGYRVAVQVEKDKNCQTVLGARFPDSRIFGDVTEVSVEQVLEALGGRRPHILIGGFPCTDLSVAGGRAGLAGTRSGLYGELIRLADGLLPEWVVVENVPGLLSADIDPEANDGAGWGPGTAMGLVLGDLTGYRPPIPDGGWRNSGVCVGPLRSVAWRVLDARHFGVAQRRRRVFLVAHVGDGTAPAEVLLEPEVMRGDPPQGVAPRPRASRPVAPAAVRAGVGTADGAGEGDAGPARPLMTAEQGIVSALTSSLGEGGPDAAHAHAGWFVEVEEQDVTSSLLASAGAGRIRTEEAAGGQLVPLDEGAGFTLEYLAGSCPTQAWGWLPDSSPFYFRARHGRWTIEVGNIGWPLLYDQWPEDPEVLTSGEDPTHGHMSAQDVRRILSETFAVGDTRATELVVEAVDLRNGGLSTEVTSTLQSHGRSYSLNAQPTILEHVPDVTATVTAKWAKGSGGPAGDEAQNLVATDPETYNPVPIDLKAATKTDHRTGVGTVGAGFGDPGDPIGTLTTGSTQGVSGPRVRRLTPTECERLMGMPDGWCNPDGKTSDSAVYRACGNAVVMAVSAWVAWRLAAYDAGWRP